MDNIDQAGKKFILSQLQNTRKLYICVCVWNEISALNENKIYYHKGN